MPIVETGLLGHDAVRTCLYGLGLAGLIRATLYLRYQGGATSEWPADSIVALCLALGFAIFIAGRLSLFGFENDDEIYSWNKWAIDFYLDREITFQFTKWAYPLLFPRLLNLGYILNGSLEAQTAVKTALAIFPLCAMGAVALGCASQTKIRAALTALLLILIVFVVRAKSSFEDGMPDTMVAAAVVISALILFERDRFKLSSLGLYLLIAMLGSVGVLTKQPALVWGLFTLPLLFAFPSLMGANRSKEMYLLLTPAVVAIIWWLTEGAGFHLNEGPVKRSMEDRDLIQQALNSVKLLFTDYAEVSVLLAWMLFAVFRNGRAVILTIGFILPSLAFWLMFANYDLRAGMPALLVAGLIISLNDFGLAKRELQPGPRQQSYKVPAVVCSLLIIGASLQVFRDVQKTTERYAGYHYGDVAINNYFRIFGADAPIVRQHLRDNEEAVLWTPTHYVYGLFYGYTDVHFPHYKSGWDQTDLINELRNTQANYATTSGRLAYGPGGKVFENVLNGPCKTAFRKINKSESPYNISVFSINRQTLTSSACDY
tara:strand:- start:56 stop:1687 length:1632 start_codon:yes stop_codon:yes gene_type:complete